MVMSKTQSSLERLICGPDFPRSDADDQNPVSLSDQSGGFGFVVSTSSDALLAAGHPGEFIRDEILAEVNLNVSEALRVEKAFGVDMEMLLRISLRLQGWRPTSQIRSQRVRRGYLLFSSRNLA